MVKLVVLAMSLILLVAGKPFGDAGHEHYFISQSGGKDVITWKQIRIASKVVQNLQLVSKSILKAVEATIEDVHRYYAQLLAVHQYETNLSFSGFTNCSHIAIPYDHQSNGVAADIVFYVTFSSSDSSNYGSTHVCLYDLIDFNPAAAVITINVMNVESKMQYLFPILVNLYAKGLGFGSYTYIFARKPDGSLYNDTEMIYNDFDDFERPVRRLKSPSVLSAASRIFQSDYPTGIPLSNDTEDIEFSSRAMFGDIMSDSPPEFKYQFSTLSLSFFQDLGWYAVDFSRASTIVFGAKRDAFLEESCVTGNFPEFCNATASPPLSSCDAYHLNKATCSSSNFTAGCGIFVDLSHSGSCQGLTPILFDPDQGEEVCAECRCFNTSLGKVQANDFRPLCHRVTCSENIARVKINDTTVECPSLGGTVSVREMAGYLECPSFNVLCGGFGCPSFCSGSGQCINGKCKCDEGFYSANCSLTCPERCTTCSGKSCYVCVENANQEYSIYTGLYTCNCNSGSYYDERTNRCVKCTGGCATCEKSPLNCLTCSSSLVLRAGRCVCREGTFSSATGSCISCENSCKECALSAGNCLTCKPNFLLTETNKCICPEGKYLETFQSLCSSCNSQCLTCTSATVCTSCAPTLVLNAGKCACQDGHSVNSTGICTACYDTCGTCNVKPNSCSSCSNKQYELHSVYGICTRNSMRETTTGLSPIFSDFLTKDPYYKMECIGNVFGCFPIVRRGYFLTGETVLQLGPNNHTGAIYLKPEFLIGFYVRLFPTDNETVLISKVAHEGYRYLSFGISERHTLFLNVTMRSYSEAHMGKYGHIEIDTMIDVPTDKWVSPRFRLYSSAATSTAASGTMIEISLGTVKKRYLYKEALYEDIYEGIEQSFVVGGLWTSTGMQNTFVGYLGELAIKTYSYGEDMFCGCPVCTASANVCLSNCSFFEQDVGPSSCEPY